MIDLERQRAEVEELKRKFRRNKKPSSPQEDQGGSQRLEVAVESTEEGENLRQGIRREDNMWDARGHAELEADQKASEAGTRWLEALEKELRDQEEESRLEKARLRAEELKKRSQERESTAVDQPVKAVKAAPDEPSEATPTSMSQAGQIYLELMQLAYRDGPPDATAAEILALLRRRFGITDLEHERSQQKVQLEIYSQAVADAWRNGVGTRQAFEKLDLLREQFNISADVHLRLERHARRQTLRRTAAGTS
ncbi:MAG TPA: hypothetical protein DEP53_06055 [Bacteroidetes bacterium]|nr:hypothetical protein [Bacteroidota bacterium]